MSYRRTGFLDSSVCLLQCRRPCFNFWVGKIHWRRDRLPTPVFLGFPHGSAGKESVCNVGDLDLIPGLERSPGEGKGYPLQYSGLENPMDCIVQESDTTDSQESFPTPQFKNITSLHSSQKNYTKKILMTQITTMV